jgi:hypothetical protein
MKQTIILVVLLSMVMVFGRCDKDDGNNDYFKLLTGPTWVADSLLADGMDASGPGMPLELFKGEAKFREDGTGTFGQYTGTWRFQMGRTELVIQTDAHPIPITAKIEELTEESLKITTGFPVIDTGEVLAIRMTFKPK